MSGAQLPLIVTCGNPSGIGPEITLRAWMTRSLAQRPFCLIADPAHISRCIDQIGLNVPIRICSIQETAQVFNSALPILPLSAPIKGELGAPCLEDAEGTIEAIRRAVDYVHQGAAHGIVTNPIAKDFLYRAGFTYPGHTEYLAALAQDIWGIPTQAVMMLWSPSLAVVPITIHVALRQAIADVTTDLVISTARIVAHDLRHYFGIAQPRLAFAGLNPHAGENGAMGDEDRTIIAPALAELAHEGLHVRGPLPADTMFHAAARAQYDVALCMYHDQALIPLKTLAFDEGVNVTLGLPFIRTSPDHGTAFDIADKGIARADSLIAALHLADRLTPPLRGGV